MGGDYRCVRAEKSSRGKERVTPNFEEIEKPAGRMHGK